MKMKFRINNLTLKLNNKNNRNQKTPLNSPFNLDYVAIDLLN